MSQVDRTIGALAVMGAAGYAAVRRQVRAGLERFADDLLQS